METTALKRMSLLGFLAIMVGACSNFNEPLQDNASSQKTALVTQTELTADVTLNEVRAIAKKFPANHADKRLVNAKTQESAKFSIYTIKNDLGLPVVFVINYKNNAGFLLLSATKKHEPVLAFSYTGNFPIGSEKPEPLEAWIENAKSLLTKASEFPNDSLAFYRQRWLDLQNYGMSPSPKKSSSILRSSEEDEVNPDHIFMEQVNRFTSEGYTVHFMDELVITGDKALDDEIKARAEGSIYPLYDWEKYSFVVESNVYDQDIVNDFATCKWDQQENFNDSCPIINGKRALVGCGPVAIGQAMYCKRYSGSTSFNWNAMGDYYSTPECARMLHNIGLVASAKYGVDETSVEISGIEHAFHHYGYYTSTIKHDFHKTFASLKTRMPVVMLGNLSSNNHGSAGHAWLATGGETDNGHRHLELYTFIDATTMNCIWQQNDHFVQNRFVYMNWGWGGRGDGFYGDDIASYAMNDDNYTIKNRKDIILTIQ